MLLQSQCNIRNEQAIYILLQSTFVDEVEHTRAQHEAHMRSLLDVFVARKTLHKNAMNRIGEMKDGGLLVMAGKPGSGKSAFMVRMCTMHMNRLNTA